MAEWSRERQQLLLAFMFHNRRVLDAVRASLSPRDLANQYLLEMAIPFEALIQYVDEHGDLPGDLLLFRPKLEECLKTFTGPDAVPGVEESVRKAVSSIFEADGELFEREEKVGMRLVSSFLSDFYIKGKLSRLVSSDLDLGALRERLSSLVSEIGALNTEERALHVQPLKAPELLLSGLKIVRSGVKVWDALFGGLRHSETYLILGGTGCGKSTLAVQLSVSVASRGNPVYYATFEERAVKDADPENTDGPKRSEFLIRALGVLGSLSRREFDRVASDPAQGVKTFEALPESIKTMALQFKESPAAENFNVYDYTMAGLHSATISAVLDDIRKTHKETPLKLVVIDPLWPLVLRTAAALRTGSDPQQLRVIGQGMAEQLNQFCKELQIPLVLTHQLGASAAGSRTRSRGSLNVYGSAEIRTIAWRFENVAVIVTPNQDGECGLIRAKSRFSGEMNYLVRAKLDGDRNQFIEGGVSAGPLKAENVVDPSGKKKFFEAADEIAEVVFKGPADA